MGTTHFSKPTVVVGLKALLTSGAPPAPVVSQVDHEPTIALSPGTGPGSADICLSQAFTVTAGTPFTVSLVTGLDPLGNALSMSAVVAVLVENDSTVAAQALTVGGGTGAVLGGDRFTCQANGGVVLVYNPGAGYAVVGGTSDTLQITVAAGTASGKLTVFGR
jgi:hypothetical protein